MTHGMPPDPDLRPRRTIVGALVTALVTLVVIVLIVWAIGAFA
jgi:hypothetical protein